MSAFLKTLFGDRATVTAVTVVMAGEGVLVMAGQTAAAVFAVPMIVLVGIAWLATR